MAGFAVLIGSDLAPQAFELDFISLLRLTAQYKQLRIPPMTVRGKNCIAAKLDSPASLHPGIVCDDETGSWLLAAGTIVALAGDNQPNAVLQSLLQDYIDRGAKALEAYDGHFALIIYNGREDRLSVVSDTIGLFGIFYGQCGSQVFVSSSALAVATQIQSRPDVLAAEHFLRTGRLDADKTLWHDVKRLLGGMVLQVHRGNVEITEYWAPTFDPSTSQLPFEAALDQSLDLLTRAFSRILAREGKTWVDLTGGFDSRLVAMLVEKTNVPFRVYCMGPEDHPDVQLSQQVSKAMQWDYVHTQLPDYWGPEQYAWFSTALGAGDGRATVLRSAVTLRGFLQRNTTVKTNVMGVGGENFRGYRWQIEGRNMGRTSKVNYDAWLDNILSSNLPLQVMRYDRTQEVRRELYEFISQLCSRYSTLPNTVQIDRFEFGRDAGLGGAYLSAVVGLGRSLAPLFFKAPANFAFSLNYHWKYPQHHIFVRALMERENKDLANVATTTGGPAIPIRLSNIHRFWPLWKNMTNRAVAIGSKRLLGKTMQVWPPPPLSSGYPLPAWRTTFYSYARSEGLLAYDAMDSRGLYRRGEFMAYVERAAASPPPSSEFLDRVISVEMAMRASGSQID
jgi:hypothetical protein